MRRTGLRANRRTGLQAEVLISLALLMLAATGIAAAVVRFADEARVRDLVGRSLQREARAPGAPAHSIYPGTLWWRVAEGREVRPWGPVSDRIDPVSLELAEQARARSATVVRPSQGSEPLRFATVLPDGSVAVARLTEDASRQIEAVPASLLMGLLAVDAAIFAAFGVALLRRRAVRPLQRVASAARTLAEGDLRIRVPVEGVRETEELGRSFNEMGEALAARTEALEKAVSDLRSANRELQEAREGLDRAERLASVGHLAAGVAHEVGNPIGAMLAFLDLANRDPSLSEAARAHLERAARQGSRVRTILRQLLDLSRPPEGRLEPLDAGAAAEEAAALVRAQRAYADVAIEIDADAASPRALADPGVLGQVLLNLLLNAADAIGSSRGAGRVRVSVRGAPLRRRATDPPDAAPARRRPDGVAIEVDDDGPGIPEGDRERVFSPFFTTKEPGQGTGLGLTNAQRLVESMGGTLSLASPGELGGACFRVVLPAEPAGDAQRVRAEA